MKLMESVINKQSYQKENLPEGILARVTYPIMRFDQVNANKRKYGKKVAEKVLKDPAIIEKLKTRTLFGDSEHPEFVQAKLNPNTTANIISDLYIDESTSTLNAVVDILPTLAGKFIFTLYEAGCDVGVSTRAEGDLSEEIDESTKEKVFSVVPESYRLSCLDHTADPSTPNARPLEFVKAVKANYESKVFDKESTISLLESVKTPEANSLLESIKSESIKDEIKDINAQAKKIADINKDLKARLKDPIVDPQIKNADEFNRTLESKMKPGAIVVLKEGYHGILNQMFARSGKAIVQVGNTRKMVSLSECTLFEDYGSGDGSGLLASKKDKKEKETLMDKEIHGSDTFTCSKCAQTKSMADVGTHSFEDYTCKKCAEATNESLVQELKDISGEETLPSDNTGADSQTREIEGQDTPDQIDQVPADNPELTPANTDATQTIDSFEFVEDLYDYAVTLEPKLQEYDKNEVIMGLTDEIAEHADTVLENDVKKLVDLVCVHLEELPTYYSVVEDALEQAMGGENEQAGEDISPENNDGDQALQPPVQEAIDTKRDSSSDKYKEDTGEAEAPEGQGAKAVNGEVNPEETEANPHHVDQPVTGNISKPGLYVVRHASTSYNNPDKSKDVVRGWTDVPLDAKGQEQARLIGSAFEGIQVDKVYYSDLSRTADTAKAIADANGNPEMVSEEAFRSWNMGDFQGKSSVDAIPELEKYAKDKPDEEIPGGESFKEFSERAISAFKKVIEEVKSTGNTTVIVTHYRDIKLFQAWSATKTDDYSIDPNTFLSDDVEPGTVFYVNMETEGMINMDKVWEIDMKQDAKSTMESVNESSMQVDYNGTAIGWEKGVGHFWGKDANGKPKVTTDAKKIALIKKELSKRKDESLNEDENIGDHMNLQAQKLYKKNYKDLNDEEKEAVKHKSTAGNFPTREAIVHIEKKFKVQEAILKAENESLLEEAEALVNSTRENYIKDINDYTGVQSDLNKAISTNESLKKAIESKEKEIERLASQISESLKSLEATKALVETKNEEVANLQYMLEEAKVAHTEGILNERIRATAKVTGLTLGESEIKQLRECKGDGEFFKKLESIRESVAQRILHQNVLTEIKITESVEEKPVTVGGDLKLPRSIVENIGTALDHMSGRGSKKK